MKMMMVTDLHGNPFKYEKLYNEALKIKPDIIINAGDLYLNGRNLFNQRQYIFGHLNRHLELFNALGIHYLLIPGNDDLRVYDKNLQKICDKYQYVINLAKGKVKIKGYEFIGFDLCVDYPFALKDRCRRDDKDHEIGFQTDSGFLSKKYGFKIIDNWEDYIKTLPTIEDELKKLKKPKDMSKAIYVMHMPPANLGLDICLFDEKAGSEAIYRFIEKNQPLLSIHGHIHESPDMSGVWKAEIGKTVCIQPGQLEDLKGLAYVVIDLETMKCERVRV